MFASGLEDIVLLYSIQLLFSRSVKSDSARPWTISHQAPLSMGFSRQEYWSGLPFPCPGYLPDPGITKLLHLKKQSNYNSKTCLQLSQPLYCDISLTLCVLGSEIRRLFSKCLYCVKDKNKNEEHCSKSFRQSHTSWLYPKILWK